MEYVTKIGWRDFDEAFAVRTGEMERRLGGFIERRVGW